MYINSVLVVGLIKRDIPHPMYKRTNCSPGQRPFIHYKLFIKNLFNNLELGLWFSVILLTDYYQLVDFNTLLGLL